MYIAVYTIALDEAKFAQRWVDSVRDADYLVVADTGSNDNTPQILNNLGVQVYNIGVRPWRFDDARNIALGLLPSHCDVCLSMDMDELMAPGWRSELEKSWIPGTTRLRYNYVHSFDSMDQPLVTYSADKCHSRWGYKWKRPVHETVFSSQDETIVTNMNMTMWQKQDPHKTSRSQYLPLLELSYQENPDCSQTLFWLAREHAYQNNTEKAVELFKTFITMPHAWSIEKSEAERWLSRFLVNEKIYWLRSACNTAPFRREPWLELAEYYYQSCDWLNCWAASSEALKITNKTGSYLDNNDAWGAKLWDLAGISCWNLQMWEKSVEYFTQAVALDPTDQRLQLNLLIARRKVT